jgi:RNA polymerase sigma-70 factor, ECF subfamily
VLGTRLGSAPLSVRMRRTSIDLAPGSEIEEIYRADGAKLYRALLLFTGQPEIAKDAAAEAFAQALRRGAALRSPERWIWRVAYRVAAGELQRWRNTSGALPENGYEVPQTSLELAIAMRGLSAMQRAAVALHDYAGYSLRETAAIAGSTPSAISVHLVRAHRKLRASLEVDDD